MIEYAYPWIKAIHIIAVISWMAGIFYLPRLFVHHVEQAAGQPTMKNVFIMMQGKLLGVIMWPAMIVTWAAGVTLAAIPGVVDWGSYWPWAKLIAIIMMTGFQIWCAHHHNLLRQDSDLRSGRYYRLMNEVPTVLLIVIVVSVIVRPI